MKGLIKKLLCFSVLSLLAASSSLVYASGYKLEFQSASILADAGEAAAIEDAGTNWYNPAGLVYLPHQLVASAIDIYPRSKFTGTTTASPLLPISQTGSVSSTAQIILPAFHYSFPFKKRWAVGLSVVPAWGLAENYGQASMLRYDVVKLSSRNIDIAPSIAFKINEKWSLGAGPDFNYFYLMNNSRSRTQEFFGTVNDSISRVSADDWNYGWHLGALFRVSDNTRFGLNYRSKITMHLSGYSSLTATGGVISGAPETNNFTFHLTLPPTTTFSVYQDLSPCWALLATIAYDQWTVSRNYNAQNYMSINPATAVRRPVNVTLYQGFKNTFDLSVGTHYKLNDKWMLRGSIKYLPTPTGNQYRNVDFPDGNKLGINIGSRLQMNKKLALDLIYGHVFTQNASIRNTNPVTGATSKGHTSTAIDLAGLQLVWNI